MIRLYIKNEYTTTQSRMLVKTESSQDVFLIVGKYGRINDTLSLYNLAGDRLVELKQKTLSVFPTFDLKINQEPFGKVKKYPGIFGIYKPRFKVTKLNWVVTGDFVKRNYTVRRNAKKIMEVSKHMSSFGEFHVLTIYEEEKAPLCSLLSVIIDHYSPKQDKSIEKSLEEEYEIGNINSFEIKNSDNPYND